MQAETTCAEIFLSIAKFVMTDTLIVVNTRVGGV